MEEAKLLYFVGFFIFLFLTIKSGFAASCGPEWFEQPSATLQSGIEEIAAIAPATPDTQKAEQTGVALYVFVSLSMPKPALIALNKDAARFGAALVLRGLKDNQYSATAEHLKPIIEQSGQGFLIHPQWFTQFKIDTVPTFVLSKTDAAGNVRFDKVSGHISVDEALTQIEQAGELSSDATQWRQRHAP